MKKISIIFTFAFLLYSYSIIAQKSLEFASISPSENHYAKLSALNSAGLNVELDSQRFPLKDFSLRNLKLRAVYLDVPVSTFKLKNPPANSSAQTKAELEFLLKLQKNRTPTDIKMTDSMAEVFYSPYTLNPFDPDFERNAVSPFFIGRTLGKWYNYKNLPETSRVLQNAIQDATYYFWNLKVDYSRPRPYQLSPEIKNLETPKHASYPSGHSSASYVNAFILSEVFPERKEEFLINAYDMAFSREIRGVHYPSDSEAGKVFARQFVDLLFKSPSFKADFKKMKVELTNAKIKNGN